MRLHAGSKTTLEELVPDPRSAADAQFEVEDLRQFDGELELDALQARGLEAQARAYPRDPLWKEAECSASVLASQAGLSDGELGVLTYVLWLGGRPKRGSLVRFAHAGGRSPATVRGHWHSVKRKLRRKGRDLAALQELSAQGKAVMFVRAALTTGSAPTADLMKAATAAKISHRNLERARNSMGVDARRIGGRHGHWELRFRNSDLTVADVARRSRRSRSTILGWLAAGRIPGAYKMRHLGWRVPPAALAAFVARGWHLHEGELRWRAPRTGEWLMNE